MGRYCFHRHLSVNKGSTFEGRGSVLEGGGSAFGEGVADPPPPEIRSTGSRYVSYWNAFLFVKKKYSKTLIVRSFVYLAYSGGAPIKRTTNVIDSNRVHRQVYNLERKVTAQLSDRITEVLLYMQYGGSTLQY